MKPDVTTASRDVSARGDDVKKSPRNSNPNSSHRIRMSITNLNMPWLWDEECKYKLLLFGIESPFYTMKRRGLDSAESWGIAVASIVVNFLILGPARLSGVLFVAIMERYGVDRKQASLPFTVCYVLRTLPGIHRT